MPRARQKSSKGLNLENRSIFYKISSFGLIFLLFFAKAGFATSSLAEILASPNLFSVRRGLEQIRKAPGPDRGRAWAALIALERLSGRLSEAQDLIEACDGTCIAELPKAERESIRLWICPQSLKYLICQR